MATVGIIFALILAAVLLYSFLKKTPSPAATAGAGTPQNYFNPDES